MQMPRGEPTRAVTIRIPEHMAVDLEERAKREGQTLTTRLQDIVLATVRMPNRLYTWAESEERKKALRQVDQWRGKTVALRSERDTPARLLGQIRSEFDLPPELRAAIDAALSV